MMRPNINDVIKKYRKGGEVKPEEEELIEELCLTGILEKGLNIETGKPRARLNKEYEQYFYPDLKHKILFFLEKIGKYVLSE